MTTGSIAPSQWLVDTHATHTIYRSLSLSTFNVPINILNMILRNDTTYISLFPMYSLVYKAIVRDTYMWIYIYIIWGQFEPLRCDGILVARIKRKIFRRKCCRQCMLLHFLKQKKKSYNRLDIQGLSTESEEKKNKKNEKTKGL